MLLGPGLFCVQFACSLQVLQRLPIVQERVEVNWLRQLGLSVNECLSLMLWCTCDLPRVYLSSSTKAVGISSNLPMTPLGKKAVEGGFRVQLALAINTWLYCFGFYSSQPILAWVCLFCHAWFGSDRARLWSLVAPSHCLAYMLLLAQDTVSAQSKHCLFLIMLKVVCPLLFLNCFHLFNKICCTVWLVIHFLFFSTDAVGQSKPGPLVGFITNLALLFFPCKRVVSSRNLIY